MKESAIKEIVIKHEKIEVLDRICQRPCKQFQGESQFL